MQEPIAGCGLSAARFAAEISYSGEVRTRPMKDRVREAVSICWEPPVEGSHAIDLFAGTVWGWRRHQPRGHEGDLQSSGICRRSR